MAVIGTLRWRKLFWFEAVATILAVLSPCSTTGFMRVGTNFRKPSVPTARPRGIPTSRIHCSKLPTLKMMGTFWQGMHSLSIFTARGLGEAVDFSRFRELLDVGGGSGAFDIELCTRYPNLSATVYDLPFVTGIAAEKIAESGLSGRVTTHPGDFFADPKYPAGHDVILLSMIMHDWNEQEDRGILRKCYEALAPGGAVVISELLVNDEKTGPPPAALMSLNMLVETLGGRNYTPSEYRAWLEDTGFRDVKVIWFESAGANGAVIGYKR